MKASIAVIGTGRMGSALASAFLAQQYPTTVYNRTKQRSEPLRAKGARLANSVEEAVSSADVVVVCVQDYTSANTLLRTDSVSRALRGKVLVQLGSGSPREAREGAAWAKSQGAHYLDGAIMATPNFIGETGCTILYGGPSALFTQHVDLLRVLGGNAQHVGEDPGHASALDSALLAFMWGHLFGILQGAAVSEAEGISLDAYAQHMAAIKAMLDGAAEDLTGRARQRRYAADETTLATLEAHYGAFKHLQEICETQGLNRALTDGMARIFEPAMARGHGGDDFTVLLSFMGSKIGT
jgi:3-hydroxyisobutyrate dehydrogenase-like beta-hydroxyacid dehydrogenase